MSKYKIIFWIALFLGNVAGTCYYISNPDEFYTLPQIVRVIWLSAVSAYFVAVLCIGAAMIVYSISFRDLWEG